jgi:hypothetical protein
LDAVAFQSSNNIQNPASIIIILRNIPRVHILHSVSPRLRIPSRLDKCRHHLIGITIRAFVT